MKIAFTETGDMVNTIHIVKATALSSYRCELTLIDGSTHALEMSVRELARQMADRGTVIVERDPHVDR